MKKKNDCQTKIWLMSHTNLNCSKGMPTWIATVCWNMFQLSNLNVRFMKAERGKDEASVWNRAFLAINVHGECSSSQVYVAECSWKNDQKKIGGILTWFTVIFVQIRMWRTQNYMRIFKRYSIFVDQKLIQEEIKRKILEWPHNWRLLKKGSAPWS
jgi:hypothetical protein